MHMTSFPNSQWEVECFFLAVYPTCQPTPLCLSLAWLSRLRMCLIVLATYHILLLVQLSSFPHYFKFRGGQAFSQSCSLTKEPEDVTVGFIVGRGTVAVSLMSPLFHPLPPYLHGLHCFLLFTLSIQEPC